MCYSRCMFGSNSTRFSVTSRGLHQQLVIGIALVSVIPILVLWLRWASTRGEPENPTGLIVYALVVVTGFTGYSLLRRSADNVVDIRKQVEDAVRDKGLSQETAIPTADDILAIRKCTDALVRELRGEYTDMEDRKARIEQNLARATRLESVGAMAAGVSHDLDNTFTAILGNTDIILRYAKPDASTARHIHQIESAANRALETIHAIRLCAGRGTFSAEKLDLSAFVEQMRKDLNEFAPRNTRISYDLPPGLPCVTADPSHMRTVVAGLVENAADAMRDGSGTIHVSTGKVRCDREYLRRAYLDEGLPEGEYVYVDVADEGPGIPPEIREKMFDPFYSGNIRGRGLGLALVMGIVRTHSGAVIVDSAPGNGATFRVVLPTDETRLKLPPGHSSRASIES